MKNTIYALKVALYALCAALFLSNNVRAADATFGEFLQRESTTLSSQSTDVAASRWQMAQIEKAGADGAQISRAGFGARDWQKARVPGTVLTNLVADGVHFALCTVIVDHASLPEQHKLCGLNRRGLTVGTAPVKHAVVVFDDETIVRF